MLRVLVLSGLIAASLLSVVAATPQTPNPGPSQPFSELFRGDSKPSPAAPLFGPQPSARSAQPKSKVVCGMVILVPDRIDPGIVKPPKNDVTYTMRVVPPPACAGK
jgi:hypothetical protein